MTAETILKMIEEVDPADSETLDEIDARVWCWKDGRFFEFIEQTPDLGKIFHYKHDEKHRGGSFGNLSGLPKYTRSRDALKSIRPESYEFVSIVTQEGACCEIWFDNRTNVRGPKEGEELESPLLPTEELAELHAIIQSIQYEREEKE